MTRPVSRAVWLIAVFVVAFGVASGRGLIAVAQEATPPPEATALVLPLAPDPARWCGTPRFDRARLEAIWAEVNAAGTPAAAAAWVEPEGLPADEATQAAIIAAVVEVIACNVNGGDGLRDPNLVTERHLREGLLGLPREEFDAFYAETPAPLPPEQWLMVYAVRDIRVLPDGRVACNPEIIVPGVGHFRDSLIFAQVDGRWLIDASHEGTDIYPHD